jgi:uncharacterized protein (TIRG00374 family)
VKLDRTVFAVLKDIIASRYFRLTLGMLITGISLYLAIRDVSFIDVRTSLANAKVAFLGFALLSVGITNLGKAVRWRMLLGAERERVSLQKSFMAVLAGQALNTVYPARLGDISRAYVVGGMGPGRVYTFGTIVLEKLIDMLFYMLLFLVLFFSISLPAWVNQSVLFFVGVTLLSLGTVGLVVYRPDWISRVLGKLTHRFPEAIELRLQNWINSALSSLMILKSRRDLVQALLWSALIWGTAVFTNQLSLLALDIHLPWTAPILVLIALQISLSLPSIPGNIGVFEYLCILSLAFFGIAQSPALSYGILLHLIALLPQTLIGLLFVAILGMNSQPGLSERSDIEGALNK